MSKPNPRKRSVPQRVRQKQSRPDSEPVWLWGSHAVLAATTNPKRNVHRLIGTSNAARRLSIEGAELLTAKDIDLMLPKGAVHQGIAVLADPLAPIDIAQLIDNEAKRVTVLDQVVDPHNLGAIFRSAAAFGFGGVVLQTRHAPEVTGVVAKTAAGGIETVPECRVVNIARALDALVEAGYTVIGLSGYGAAPMVDLIQKDERVAIVLGAEGAGLRPAVAKACTAMGRIPMSPAMESLNVSTAAAVAFYLAAADDYS
ncbi:MAG: RNA methyltransferase [Pseudomonadota bacterium]